MRQSEVYTVFVETYPVISENNWIKQAKLNSPTKNTMNAISIAIIAAVLCATVNIFQILPIFSERTHFLLKSNKKTGPSQRRCKNSGKRLRILPQYSMISTVSLLFISYITPSSVYFDRFFNSDCSRCTNRWSREQSRLFWKSK